MLPAMTGAENGAGTTCNIENAGTTDTPTDSLSVSARETPNGTSSNA